MKLNQFSEKQGSPPPLWKELKVRGGAEEHRGGGRGGWPAECSLDALAATSPLAEDRGRPLFCRKNTHVLVTNISWERCRKKMSLAGVSRVLTTCETASIRDVQAAANSIIKWPNNQLQYVCVSKSKTFIYKVLHTQNKIHNWLRQITHLLWV